MSCFVLSTPSIFLNTKINVFTNLKPFNRVNNFIRLLLIASSVSLTCSSGLKEFKISILQVLAKSLKACCFVIFTFFLFENFHFFVLLHEELLETTFSPFLLVLDNLFEVFGCSVIIDFTSKYLGFQKFLSDK